MGRQGTVQLPSGRQVTIDAHGQRLTVVEVGGGIRAYSAGALAVLDGYAEEEMCSGARGQVLAPWPNRLGDGVFEWGGHTLQTAITEVASHTAIHGLVRWAAWRIDDVAVDRASLGHRLHPQPGWPWTIDFSVSYLLTPEGLSVRTAVCNQSDEACPLGLGWHPYLWAFGDLVDRATLTVPARVAYVSDERGLPTGRYPVLGTDMDFTSAKTVGAARLDACFTDLERGPDGRAIVELSSPDGSRSARVWVDRAYSHLMVFTGDTLADPARRRQGLAVEPMTGPPNLLRTGEGLITLGPGATFEATWGVEVFNR